MNQELYQAENSASIQNNINNGAQDSTSNIYKIELTVAQAAYLTKLLPTLYSFQIQQKTCKRTLSSQKNLKEEIKVPVQVKKKSTKEQNKSVPSKVGNNRNNRNPNKFTEQIENAVYQKYNAQKDLSRRNSFEGISESLRPCIRILNMLKNTRTSWPFRQPVDPIALGIPHYTQIVKQPMDLSTIENNLRTNQYITPTQFHADVSKIITNSYTFNSSNIQFTRLTAQFEAYYRKITSETPNDIQRGYSFTEIPTQIYPSKSVESKKKSKDSTKESHQYGGSLGPAISMAEKKELGLNIKKLPKEHMKGILDIVNEGKVKMIGQFDLKELDPYVIRKLQLYVKEKLSGESKSKPGFGQDKQKEFQQKQQSSFELDEQDES